MSDDVIQPSQALILRPQVLPSLAQFEIERQLAGRLFKARGFLPNHYMVGPDEERFAKVLAAIEYGRAVGIEPMIALQNLSNIDGKIGASALLIGAQLRKSGYDPVTSWFDKAGARVPKESPEVWGCKVVLFKNERETGDGVFSLTDAQRAGLIKDGSGWAKYPKDMLYARALTQAAREGAQDAVLGMAYTAEELGADVDSDGQVITIPPPPGAVVDAGYVDVVDGQVSGVSEPLPTGAAIQPAPPAPPGAQQQPEGESPQGVGIETSPTTAPPTAVPAPPAVPSQGAPAAEVTREATPAAEVTQAPPVNVAPLSGPALARRMGAGRSIGPAPRRTNTVTVERQAPTVPTTAPEAPPQAPTSAEAVPSQPAPPGLTDEPVAAAPVDDGLAPQRELLRVAAAELAHVNAVLFNKITAPLENKALLPVPPTTPGAVSDEGLARLIDRDYPGRSLANLDGEALQNRLELVDANLAKKKALMLERGITEE